MSARRDPPRPAGTLRVATWNLWCRNGDWRARQPAIFDVLRGVDADVVGFQEVSTREPDQIASLRDELGYAVVTAPDGDDDRHGIANAIASRWPIVETVWRYLDVGSMPPHRTVLRATISSPHGVLRVYCTHLSHGFDQSGLRRRQLDQVAALVAEERDGPYRAYPPIVLGDLNAVPDSDEVRRLTGLTEPAVPGSGVHRRLGAGGAWAGSDVLRVEPVRRRLGLAGATARLRTGGLAQAVPARQPGTSRPDRCRTGGRRAGLRPLRRHRRSAVDRAASGDDVEP